MTVLLCVDVNTVYMYLYARMISPDGTQCGCSEQQQLPVVVTVVPRTTAAPFNLIPDS